MGYINQKTELPDGYTYVAADVNKVVEIDGVEYKLQAFSECPGYKKYADFLGASIKARYTKSSYAYAYLDANANVRAIIAMIFFATAACLFIAAGVIGYKRATKLHKYLASISVKK